ncbi:MAG: hypothetical protein IJV31_07935 [Clostridia bacterium]|nr:hypothetical protein [Clostridia bacterium]
MKKKILITIVVIIAIILAIGVGKLVQDINEEKKLTEEFEEISKLIEEDEIKFDEINEILNRTVAKKDYAIVEKAVKTWYSDFVNNAKEMLDILNDEKLVKILSAENIKTDGPEFNSTKEYISNTKQKLESCKVTYYELAKEEKIMSYINDKNLDEYYIDYYKKEIFADVEQEQKDKTVENSLNEIIDLLEKSEKIIDFLIENKEKWQFENETLMFDTQALANKYNELLEEISK